MSHDAFVALRTTDKILFHRAGLDSKTFPLKPAARAKLVKEPALLILLQ